MSTTGDALSAYLTRETMSEYWSSLTDGQRDYFAELADRYRLEKQEERAAQAFNEVDQALYDNAVHLDQERVGRLMDHLQELWDECEV